jgi:hypothetical protein
MERGWQVDAEPLPMLRREMGLPITAENLQRGSFAGIPANAARSRVDSGHMAVHSEKDTKATQWL